MEDGLDRLDEPEDRKKSWAMLLAWDSKDNYDFVAVLAACSGPTGDEASQQLLMG